ncbi:hypothetical protein ES703_22113 [subsurface metagenome]
MKRCSYRRITSRIIILLAVGLCLASPARAQFTEVTTITDSLTGVSYSSAAWGDYDNDGDLDILLTGYNGARHAIIYRNDDSTFVDIEAGLTAVSFSSVAWGDYDNDGDLDILLTGADGPTTRTSKVYRNDGEGSFTDISAGLPGVYEGSVAWGDYDNDGDLDILLTGYIGSSIARLYRNDGDDSFTDILVWLDTNYKTAAAWGDYDNDGDLDILLTRSTGGSQIYENDGGSFTPDASIWLQGVFDGSVAWGDYDNDGDLDILLTGNPDSSPYQASKVYRNDGEAGFTDLYAELEIVDNSSVAWGDYDNDGNLDILLSGDYVTSVYQNIGEDSFSDISAELTGVAIGSVAWGDYDTDGDLDILLTGFTAGQSHIAKVYENTSEVINGVPAAPTGLQSEVNQDTVTLSWTIPEDSDETYNLGLSYNLRVGTTSGGDELMSAQATSAGDRLIPALGNVQENLSWNLYDLPDDSIYWSVQSIDAGFAGSAFAVEDTFVIAVPPATPQNLIVGTYYDIGAVPLIWNQNTESDFLRYRIYMDTESVPTTLVDSTSDNAIGETTITITGLTVGTTYYFRVKAVDAGLIESVDFSNEVNMTPALYSLKTDSLALVELYNATDGDNWTNKTDWLTGPVSSWYRVTVTDGRVAEVKPSGNNLSGTIPSSIGDLVNLTILRLETNRLSGAVPTEIDSLTSLTDLRLSDNQLTAIPDEINNLIQLQYLYLKNNQLVALPDLTALTSTLIYVDGNRLTFEDIEPNILVLDDYSPQDSVGAEKDTTVEAGTSLALSVSVGGTANSYQWIRSGQYISGATDDTLMLDPVVESDAGDYVCQIRNSIAGLLRLYSRPNHVTVINTAAPAAPQNLEFVAGDGQVTLTWNKNTESDFLRYRVYSGTAANPTTQVDSTSSITDTTKTLTGLTNDTAYYFRITAVDVAFNESAYSSEVSATPISLSVSDQDALPTEFALHQNHPNPFNPTTTLRFDLPEASDASIVVYDLMGREVVRLVEGHQDAGWQAVVWDGRDARGRAVPTGIYIARLSIIPPTAGATPQETRAMKLVMMK